MRSLISDGVFPGVAGTLASLVEGSGVDLQVASSAEEAREALPEVDLLVVKNFPVDASTVACGRRLRGVQKLGVLTDTVDLAALRQRSIPFRKLNLPSSLAVADHAMTLMLALIRQLDPSREAMHKASAVEPIVTDERRYAYNWAAIPTAMLNGKTLGLVGFGEVAAEVARRARAFGMRVSYTKRSPLPEATERRLGVKFVSMEALLAGSDVISLHVPHTPQTERMIGAAELAAMKRGAYLINTARGGIVDEKALVDSLRSGQLGGAGLDVFAVEPLPPDSPLLEAPRTILTPHVGGAGSEALAEAVAGALKRWAKLLQ